MINKLKQLKGLKPKKTKDTVVYRINEYLKSQHNQPLPYTPKPANTPSLLGSKCYRKLYYNYFKVAKDYKTDAKGCRIFESGIWHESMIMSWLIAMGEHIPFREESGEIPVDRRTGKPNPQFPLKPSRFKINKGFVDNVAIVDGKLWLYEFKSSNENKFIQLENPSEDHMYQIAVYYYEFTRALQAGEYSHIEELNNITKIEGIKVFYINKNTSDLKEFTIPTDELNKWVDKVDKKVEKLSTFTDSRTLPPKTLDYCNYCAFRKKCKNDWNDINS